MKIVFRFFIKISKNYCGKVQFFLKIFLSIEEKIKIFYFSLEFLKISINFASDRNFSKKIPIFQDFF